MDQPTNNQLIDQLGAGAGTLAAKVSEMGTAVLLSDHEGAVLHLGYLQKVAALPNVVMEQREDIGFGLGEVARRDERAAFTQVNLDRMGYTEVEMAFSMRIAAKTSASSENEAKVGSETTVEVSGGLPWAKVRGKQTITAEFRHNSKQTRDTDMSASLEGTVKMARLPVSEGVAGMNDTANEFSRKLNELRLRIASAKVDRMIEQIESGEADVDALEAQGVEEAAEAEPKAA